MTKKVNILGVLFNKVTLDCLVNKKINEHVRNQEKVHIVTANPEIVVHALEDKKYRQIINQADYITADGIGIVMASKILGDPIDERVAGYDILRESLVLANDNESSCYFFGAKNSTLSKLIDNIKRDYPKLTIAGYHNGYDYNENAIREEIVQVAPDFIFVALGMPKQEMFIQHLYPHLTKGLCIGVGGSFDVIAGEVKRAPDFWIKLHLEWLYRTVMQPKRLIRNIKLLKFLLLVFKEKSIKKKGGE